VSLVPDVFAFVEASAQSGALLHVADLGPVAHIARAPARPVDVAALAALPVLGAEQTLALLSSVLADLHTQLLLATARCRALHVAPVTLMPASKIDVATRGIWTSPVTVGGLEILNLATHPGLGDSRPPTNRSPSQRDFFKRLSKAE